MEKWQLVIRRTCTELTWNHTPKRNWNTTPYQITWSKWNCQNSGAVHNSNRQSEWSTLTDSSQVWGLDNVKHPDYKSTTTKRPCRAEHNTDIRRVPRILRSAFCRRYRHSSNRHISGRHRVDVEKRLQEAVTCWNDRLRATGGSLKHKKCYYYSIGYVWKNGDWSYDEPSPDSQG